MLPTATTPEENKLRNQVFISMYVPTIQGLLATYPFIVVSDTVHPQMVRADQSADPQFANTLAIDLNYGQYEPFAELASILTDNLVADGKLTVMPGPMLGTVNHAIRRTGPSEQCTRVLLAGNTVDTAEQIRNFIREILPEQLADVAATILRRIGIVLQILRMGINLGAQYYWADIVGFDSVIGRCAGPTETWYDNFEDLPQGFIRTKTDYDNANGDGTVPLISSARFALMAQSSISTKTLEVKPQLGVGHMSLLGDPKSQMDILRAIGVENPRRCSI